MTAPVDAPPYVGLNADGIPQALRDEDRLLGWRAELRDGHWTKVPYNAVTGGHGSSTDPSTWSSFEDAIAGLERYGFTGIGYALEDSGNVGIDLDGCRDPATGAIDAWAMAIVEQLDTYTEVSPSGTGLRLILIGKLSGRGHNKKLHKLDPARYPREKAGIEVYDSGRFVTITGQHLPGTPLTIESRQDALNVIHDQFWPPKRPSSSPNGKAGTPVHFADPTLLEKMFASKSGAAISALWNGDTSAYGNDHSSADMALMNHLVWWTNGDHQRMERLFSESVLGQRDKWRDRPDYRAMTIDEAFDVWNGEGYTPPSPRLFGWAKRSADAAGDSQDDAEDAVEPFPTGLLPDRLRAFVDQAASSLVCPPDMVAIPLLVSVGSVIGNRRELQIKPGWRESANLYAVIIGDPGSKKTPGLTQGTKPLYWLQGRLKERYDASCADWDRDVAAWEAIPKAQRPERPKPPRFEHVVTSDATTEALAVMLANSNGIELVKDELVGLVKGMDQYRGGRGADRQHFLSFWSRTPTKVDRKGADPIFVANPCLSVVGGIQPDLLPDLGDAAKREDGFLDRFLLSWPASLPDRWSDDGVSLDALQAVERDVETLHQLGDHLVVEFSPRACQLWREWYEQRSAEMEGHGFPRALRGPWAKLPSQFARIALILHCLDDPHSVALTDETLGRAADLIEYFKFHAARVYRALGSQRSDLTMKVLGALKANGALTKRELIHDVFKRNILAERLTTVLEELEEAGLLKREVREGKGGVGRPAEVWSLA